MNNERKKSNAIGGIKNGREYVIDEGWVGEEVHMFLSFVSFHCNPAL
jgi:hypothetical protein